MIEHAYIHIPFCIRKCKYCSFVSGLSINQKEQYMDVLYSEINNKYKGELLKTIYIGGGTPSLLTSEDIKNLLSLFNYNNDTEITIEVNPETVSIEKFKQFNSAGINRLSLGIQTFNNKLLKDIGRNHTDEDILNSINIMKSANFKNISVDLIYGLPNQTIEMFTDDINKAVKLNIQHISTYGLKIEKGSFFYNNMPQNLPDDEKQAEMYLILCSILKNNGFEHYEISNFSKKDYQSQHNCAYWLNKEYYGFGLNASGYENNIRYRNVDDIDLYKKNPLQKAEEFILTEQKTMENEIFLALRLSKGLNINEFNKKYNVDFINEYKNIIEKYLELLKIKNNNISLTEKGFLLSNEIMSEFIS